MQAIGLTFIDWLIIAIYFGFVLGIGFYLEDSRRGRRIFSSPAARTAAWVAGIGLSLRQPGRPGTHGYDGQYL